MENSWFYLLFWMTAFLKLSIVTSFSAQSIFLNSTGNYNAQLAKWTFDLNYRIPSPVNNSSLTLRVMIELIDHIPLHNISSLFAVGSKQRFKHVEIFDRNSTYQMGNVTVDFDHAYSGRYQLKVVECKNRYSCFETIHKSDLGVVETNLSNIDVTKMNIGISTTPSDIGGIDVSFAVQYFNVSNTFLPFEKFMISLIHSDGIHLYTRKVIGETIAKFRPCMNFTNNQYTDGSTNASVDCFSLLSGEYVTRIDPIDSRCNFQEQVVASIKRPCRRYIISNITLFPIRFRREGNFELNYSSNSNLQNVANMETTVLNFNCSTFCQLLNFILHIF